MKVVYSPLAARELVTESQRYEKKAEGLGDLFIDDVEIATKQILAFPESGPRFGDRFRRVILMRFSFTIVYSTSSETLRIIAIMHQHRGPEHIAKRLSRET